jgi:lipoprotein-releasing system ATP-binding protein
VPNTIRLERTDGPLIEADGLEKVYGEGDAATYALRRVSFTLAEGEFASIIGQSGSGKSTLLNLLGLLDTPSGGTISYRGRDGGTLGKRERAQLRGSLVGFVFQFHHLLPAFTALENVTLPALMREGRITLQQRERARAVLTEVGLGKDMDKRPGELSGGMQQRVAIARAVVLEPPLVLADEPTGNLDRASSDEVFALMRRMHAELKTSFLVVTHDPRLAERCDRVIELVDGRIERDEPRA